MSSAAVVITALRVKTFSAQLKNLEKICAVAVQKMLI